MDDKLNVEESGLGLNVEPKEEETINEPTVEEEKIEELPEDLLEELDDFDELDKKNYYKITPTFYVRGVGVEEVDGEEVEVFKILNPETNIVEKRPLTEEEQREIVIHDLKESKKVFKPTKHPTKVVGTHVEVGMLGRERTVKDREIVTNLTVNKFGPKYKQKRKRRNALAKKSRKANR